MTNRSESNGSPTDRRDGSHDLAHAADSLAGRLPAALAPLARLAYNYRWSWDPEAADLFAQIEPSRWAAGGENPVRLLLEASKETLAAAASNVELAQRAAALERALQEELATPASSGCRPGSAVNSVFSRAGFPPPGASPGFPG